MARQQLAGPFRSLAVVLSPSPQKVLSVDFCFNRGGPDNPLVGDTICRFRNTSCHQRHAEWAGTQRALMPTVPSPLCSPHEERSRLQPPPYLWGVKPFKVCSPSLKSTWWQSSAPAAVWASWFLDWCRIGPQTAHPWGAFLENCHSNIVHGVRAWNLKEKPGKEVRARRGKGG